MMKVIITTVFSVMLLGLSATPLEDGVARIYPDLFDTNVVYAVYAINEHLKGNLHDGGMRTATRVLSATAKVTQGIIYEYEIELTNGTKTETCRAVVESIPWLRAPDNNLALVGDVDCLRPEHNDPSAPDTQGQENSTTPADVPPTPQYPPLKLDTGAMSALLYFVESHNAPRSTFHRLIPYDVTVEKGPLRGNGILFKFALRMVASKCVKTDMSVFGKITLDDCPPLKDEFIRYGKQKCEAKILWNPTDRHRPYTFHGYHCRLGI